MRAVVFALSVSLAACTGIVSGNGPGGGGTDGGTADAGSANVGGGGGGGSATARDYFNSNVYSVLATTCGASGCHSATTPGANAPAYVDLTTPSTDSSAAWTLITGMPSVVGDFTSSAALLTIPAGAHYAKFSADQIASINAWFALETSWRSAGSGSGTPPVDYLAQWSGCMQYTDFMTANVATAFAQQVNTNEGYCKQCHVNGQAQSYFIATPDSQNMFTAISTYREYLSTYFTVDTTTNTVVVNTIPFKLAADGGTNGAHPNNWNPTNNKGMTALNKFATLTAAHLAAGGTNCGMPTLTD